LSYYVGFDYGLCYLDKNKCCFEIFELDVEDDELCVLRFNVVFFGIKNRFEVVDDFIKSIYGDLDENLNVA